MLSDALVDEIRNNGVAFAARFNNDVAAMCEALKDTERASGRVVVDRAVRRVTGERKSAVPTIGSLIP